MVRRVLITGATGLLGRAIARHLVEEGWLVVVSSRDESRAEALAADLGNAAEGIAIDFAGPDCGERTAEALAARGLTISHLVNNARSLETLAVGPDGTTAREFFLAELDIDVVQPYRITMALVKHASHRLEAVVNIGSQYGKVAMNPALYAGDVNRMPIQYGVAKAALHHLTRELAARLRPCIRVNCVAFGGFSGRAPDEFVSRYGALHPAGRMLTPEEAGGPVAFLLGPQSSSMTGHVMMADGGWTIW
jgi:NAD(P)-dependent dehydrogenase (short-subunit alcohol dehydrogenase family)